MNISAKNNLHARIFGKSPRVLPEGWGADREAGPEARDAVDGQATPEPAHAPEAQAASDANTVANLYSLYKILACK